MSTFTSTTPLINCATFASHPLTPQLCAICLDDTIPLSSTTHTPCTNTFCTPCLTAWVTARLAAGQPPTCPTCRGLLVGDAETSRPNPRAHHYQGNPLPALPAIDRIPHQHPLSHTNPLQSERLFFEERWRTIALSALPLPHLNALLSLLGPIMMATHFQPSPIPRISNTVLTRLYDTGLMDPATQSRSTQLAAVVTHGVREWGVFSFPAADRAEELGIGEAQRRFFFVPMVPGRERNGGFVEVEGRRKGGRWERSAGRIFSSKKATVWKVRG